MVHFEWYISVVVIITALVALFFTGLPVAFAFMIMNFIGLYLWTGGINAIFMPINSALDQLTSTTLLPVGAFILMGEILGYSGAGSTIIDSIDKWIGRVPARLSVLIMASGAVFATLSGSAIAMTALMSTVFVPEISKRGYKADMVVGPIMAAGSLAPIIPPTVMGVVVASLMGVSVGRFLIAIIGPGLLLAIMYTTFIVIRGVMRPENAPSYSGGKVPFREKLLTLRYIGPTLLVIFFVIVLMFIGVCTPSEAGALGVLGVVILCITYGKAVNFNWKAAKGSVTSSAKTLIMIAIVLANSTSFSQLIAYTGASSDMAKWALSSPLPPAALFAMMMTITLILGCFMDGLSFCMICIPIFLPIIQGSGIDKILFTVALLLSVNIGALTPPFGLQLFVLQGMTPYPATQIHRIAVPYIAIAIVLIALIYIFPPLTGWLPSMMMSGAGG